MRDVDMKAGRWSPLPLVDVYKLMKIISDRVDRQLTLTITVNKEDLFDRTDFEVTLSWMNRGTLEELTFAPLMMERIVNNNDNDFLNKSVSMLFRDAVELTKEQTT